MSGISPWAKGQTSPTWTIPMVRDNGVTMNLTGVTAGELSLAIYTASPLAQIGTGGGTFAILSADPGIVQYAPVIADSQTTGNLYVRVVVNFNGTNEDMSDYLSWVVQP